MLIKLGDAMFPAKQYENQKCFPLRKVLASKPSKDYSHVNVTKQARERSLGKKSDQELAWPDSQLALIT